MLATITVVVGNQYSQLRQFLQINLGAFSGLFKLVEKMRRELRIYTYTDIYNRKTHTNRRIPGYKPVHFQSDPSLLGRELYRVVEQVDQNLLQTQDIPHQPLFSNVIILRTVLIAHLINCRFQPERRDGSRRLSINRCTSS